MLYYTAITIWVVETGLWRNFVKYCPEFKILLILYFLLHSWWKYDCWMLCMKNNILTLISILEYTSLQYTTLIKWKNKIFLAQWSFFPVQVSFFIALLVLSWYYHIFCIDFMLPLMLVFKWSNTPIFFFLFFLFILPLLKLTSQFLHES